MNIGIQEAMSLAEALAQTLRSRNSTALDEWQEKRLRVARNVVNMTDQITKGATASSPLVKLLRNIAIGFVDLVPPARQFLTETLSELRYR